MIEGGKRTKRAIILLIALMVVSVGFLSGCIEEEKEKEKSKAELIIGTWQRDDPGQDAIWRFYDNGKLTIDDNEWSYYISGDVLVFYSNGGDQAHRRMYFQGDDTLVLRDESDGHTSNFYRINR